MHPNGMALERQLDMTLAASFPASDPPPWTLGVPSSMAVPRAAFAPAAPAAVDVVIAEGRRRRRLFAMAETMAMTAMVPLVIWMIGGLLGAVAVGIANAIRWLSSGG